MRLHATIAGAAAAAALCSPAPALAAEAFYGLTADNRLVTFHSDSPARIQRSVPITGLQPGETVLGADVRPVTGQLYVLGSSNRLYLVTPLSGLARPAGDPFSPSLAGTSFGFDFNPVVNRIRVVSDGRQNLRLNPDGGQVAAEDGQLAYGEGDPGAGSNPQVSASAYSNSVAGATETELFGIDAARDALVLQAPPNAGTLKTVGPLNTDVGGQTQFDVAADGRAFVAAQRAGGGTTELFTIDLTTGALAPAAPLPGIAADLRGLAAAGPVPDDTADPAVVLATDSPRRKRALRRRITVAASCSETCGLEAVLRHGSRRLGRATGSLSEAGRTRLRFSATRARRELAKRKGTVTLTVRLKATDAAGNVTRARRTIRFG